MMSSLLINPQHLHSNEEWKRMIELSFDSVHDNVCHLHVYNSAGLYIYTIKEMYSGGGGNKRGGREDTTPPGTW